VLAATNRPRSLDEALTRPGRFDRVVNIPYPNQQGRIDILRVHSRDKLVSEHVVYERVARATAGASGAELMNLMNTAAVLAAQKARAPPPAAVPPSWFCSRQPCTWRLSCGCT
jgi:cell division protease FtsH